MEDIKLMKLAIEEAKKCISEKDKTPLCVGVIVIKDGKMLAKAHRGEISQGEHAEYTVLERKLTNVNLSGATLYTTLEPCTTRNHPKVPCAKRIVQRRIGKVVIGILDPNPKIRGKGVWVLTENKVIVEHFPHELQEEIRNLNREFIEEQLQNQKQESKTHKDASSDTKVTTTIKTGDITESSVIIVGRDANINLPSTPEKKKPVSELLKRLAEESEKRLKEGLE